MSRNEPLQVLIVDDHPLVRQSLIALLDRQPEITVVGDAADGWEALSRMAELRPDVVLMDVNMPHMDGVNATRHILDRWPDVHLVGMSMGGEGSERRILAAGAAAYIPKDSDTEILLAAITGGETGTDSFRSADSPNE